MRPKSILSFLWLITLSILIYWCTDADAADFELTPMLGYRTASLEITTGIGCIAQVGVPCPDRAMAEDDFTLGLIFNVSLSEKWSFEALLNRQDAGIAVEPFICPECNTLGLTLDDLEITTLQAGFRRQWQAGAVRPFVAVGLGLSRFAGATPARFFDIDVDDEEPSASLAAGLAVLFTNRLALRVEARTYWIDLPDENPYLVQELTETELATGLALRW